MSLVDAVLLGAIQGLTEFLPVSSSGHLVIARRLLGAEFEEAMAFDVFLHLATLAAVLVYFRRDLGAMVRALGAWLGLGPTAEAVGGSLASQNDHLLRWVWLLALATVPIALVGAFFSEHIEAAFSSLPAVGVGLMVTASALHLSSRRRPGLREAAELGPWDAIVVGLFQAVAVVPGISRSGTTIAGALMRGLERDAAARFAFLLSIPAITAAALKNAGDIAGLALTHPAALAAGSVVAFASGWLAIDIMMRAVRGGRLAPFALYCAVLGAIALVVGVL